MATLSASVTKDDEAALVRSCTDAKNNSHSPYSKFPVGSAVLVDHKTEGKKIYKGTGKLYHHPIRWGRVQQALSLTL